MSPTGSGKMTIPLLGILMLRLKMGKPKGVGIVTQPLTSIMKEKQNNGICPAAVLSMKGDLFTSSTNADAEDATLSCDLDRLLDGDYPVIFCHGESLNTKLGQFILRELQKRERQDCIQYCSPLRMLHLHYTFFFIRMKFIRRIGWTFLKNNN